MKTCLKHLFIMLALTFGLSISATAGDGDGNYKLGGAWVAKVIGQPGQWSYVVSADPSGRRASGHGSVDLGFTTESIFGGPYFEPSDTSSPILINIVKTGPDTASYYSIWYGLKDLGASSEVTNEIVYIGVVTGELKYVGPGKANGTHNFALYFPWQDTDGDGFPDEDQTTPFMFQLTTMDTRLPMPE